MKTFKLISLVSMFIFIAFFSTAQTNDKKGYIGFAFGPSFPIGEFGSSDINDSLAGLAGTGAVFELNFGYRLGKNFGIAATLRGQSNTVDKTAITNAFTILFFGGISANIEADNWSSGAYLAGLYTTVPTSSTNKISFDARLLIGIANVTSPKIKITITDMISSAWSEQSSSSASAFGILIGAGLRFNVSEKIAILTNADFFTTNPEFKNVKITTSAGDITYNNLSQTITTFNLSAGIGLRLN
jgi:hypothetical protein